MTVEDRVYQGLSTAWTVRAAGGERYTVYQQNAEPFADQAGPREGGRAYLSWDPGHEVPLE